MGCHESTDNIPGRDVIRGLPYGTFIVRGVDVHRHECWAAALREKTVVAWLLFFALFPIRRNTAWVTPTARYLLRAPEIAAAPAEPTTAPAKIFAISNQLWELPLSA